MKRQPILSRIVGNMFEQGVQLERAPEGPRGGDRGFLVGDLPVSRKMVEGLRRDGFLNGMRPTEKAILWYQDSLRDE